MISWIKGTPPKTLNEYVLLWVCFKTDYGVEHHVEYPIVAKWIGHEWETCDVESPGIEYQEIQYWCPIQSPH